MTTRSSSITVKPHHMAARRKGAHMTQPWKSPGGATPRSTWRPAAWTGWRFHLGCNRGLRRQGICHTLGHEKLRRGENRQYTASPDPTAAISRAVTDGLEPGLSLATAIVEVGDRLRLRSNTVKHTMDSGTQRSGRQRGSRRRLGQGSG